MCRHHHCDMAQLEHHTCGSTLCPDSGHFKPKPQAGGQQQHGMQVRATVRNRAGDVVYTSVLDWGDHAAVRRFGKGTRAWLAAGHSITTQAVR